MRYPVTIPGGAVQEREMLVVVWLVEVRLLGGDGTVRELIVNQVSLTSFTLGLTALLILTLHCVEGVFGTVHA